ncbi:MULTISPECIES: metallophosphoesterase family protein [Gordonia]|jgi:calcineurin-like phosphoesterase family protein|uniref:Calcineurin-like phosphoesterase domain-containing protein n=2 Tax=Gordonia alkanivorans TaxID=84096 RepID=F9W0M6_9ACTN|nr:MULTISPECIES: metallophosphoesterase [Gordonia]AZZ82819.1 metallophosphoesterase [Gordonia alkanivorans]ETA08877.1 metallophosphoesterase [Gordonia alkanivorans CGMCC 6845]MDH3005542.1 metallophosphoesterase [Gordonia alkanivorans]MDH3010161.1 metallophosphoesterase [Gordonia alkanivorans]MDH3014955.1 metallophosphoesterase [Gordonia alkanivorans]
MVRVLAVADEVVDSLTYGVGIEGRPDLILGAGDLPFDYLEILSSLCDAPCVYVPGNHDRELRGYRRGRTGWTRAGLPTEDPGPCGGINADGRTVTVAGLRISGLGGSRCYNGGTNQYTDIQQRLRSIRLRCGNILSKTALANRGGTDILLTHSPARGVGDGDDTPHQGFDCYHPLVRALRPTLLVHGHVHPYGSRPRDLPIGETTTSMNVVGFCQFDIDPATRKVDIVRRRHGA